MNGGNKTDGRGKKPHPSYQIEQFPSPRHIDTGEEFGHSCSLAPGPGLLHLSGLEETFAGGAQRPKAKLGHVSYLKYH